MCVYYYNNNTHACVFTIIIITPMRVCLLTCLLQVDTRAAQQVVGLLLIVGVAYCPYMVRAYIHGVRRADRAG